MSTAAREAEPDAHAAFAARDWGMLAGVAVTWGGSFLLIEIGLEHFAPTLVAFGRIAFGALTLARCRRRARPVPREEWPQIALVGVTWMAIPFVLFAVAQQWIDSSLAAMINATTPLMVALVAGAVHAPAAVAAPGRRPAARLRGRRGDQPAVGRRAGRTRWESAWCCSPRSCTGSRST